MNKLELLYKVVKEIKSKTEFNAIINANIIRNNEDILLMENEVYKNCEAKQATAQISGFFVSEAGKINVAENVNLWDLKSKKKAYMMEMKSKMENSEDGQKFKHNCKLSKMMFGLKVLNELELSKEDDFNVLTLDMAVIKNIIEEKMANKKCKCDPEKKLAIMSEMGIPKELIALHFFAMKELHSGFDIAEAKVYVDANNMINKIVVAGKSSSNTDTFKIQITSK
ncbi:hypothetical protein [uncultured Clostridium sp.]|jgi:hypothetical protein|uniref:hypothetical protein n=1 Tax=uncultured Clostridium sp. TaxID=59620 RepID=UPI00261F98F8|nr:hypothetical protein [uncultured Clostridium sp.]